MYSSCGGLLAAYLPRLPQREVDDHLDVVAPTLERVAVLRQRNAASDQPLQPARVAVGDRGGGQLVVAAVRVYRAEDDVVLQDDLPVEAAEIEDSGATRRGDLGEADDSVVAGPGQHVGNDRGGAGALDDDVRTEPDLARGGRVVGRAEVGDELGLGPLGHAVEHVDLEAALHPEQRGEQSESAPRSPIGSHRRVAPLRSPLSTPGDNPPTPPTTSSADPVVGQGGGESRRNHPPTAFAGPSTRRVPRRPMRLSWRAPPSPPYAPNNGPASTSLGCVDSNAPPNPWWAAGPPPTWPPGSPPNGWTGRKTRPQCPPRSCAATPSNPPPPHELRAARQAAARARRSQP